MIKIKNRVLVTGGAGFIGSHLAEELFKRGNQVTILDNFVGGTENIKYLPKEINVVKGDMCDRGICNKLTKNVDTIYHIAAHAAEGQSVFVPIFNAKTNIIGSLTLLTEAINNNVEKFVFTSSIAAYGEPKKLPIAEDHLLEPEDPYGISKKTFEDYLSVYYKIAGIKPYIVRFFNVYGPRQRMDDPYRGVIPIFINKCLKNENPIIFGDGMQKRAFTYVSDIIEQICEIVNHKELINNPINIGSDRPYTVKEVAEKIIQKLHAKVKIEFVDPRPTDVKETYCNTDKAKKILKYSPKVDIDTGLDKTIEWAKKIKSKEFKYMDYIEIEKLSHRVYKQKVL